MTMSNARASRENRQMKQKMTLPEIAHATSDQLREGYLQRLRRLLRLRRDHFEELNDQGLRLLDRSIFAAYCDCLDIGQGDAARGVLKDVRLTVVLSERRRA
jgi:hypothetical protein